MLLDLSIFCSDCHCLGLLSTALLHLDRILTPFYCKKEHMSNIQFWIRAGTMLVFIACSLTNIARFLSSVKYVVLARHPSQLPWVHLLLHSCVYDTAFGPCKSLLHLSLAWPIILQTQRRGNTRWLLSVATNACVLRWELMKASKECSLYVITDIVIINVAIISCHCKYLYTGDNLKLQVLSCVLSSRPPSWGRDAMC